MIKSSYFAITNVFFYRFVLFNASYKSESFELKGLDKWDCDKWVAFLRRTSEEGKSANSSQTMDKVKDDDYDEFSCNFKLNILISIDNGPGSTYNFNERSISVPTF